MKAKLSCTGAVCAQLAARAWAGAFCGALSTWAGADARIREVSYDPQAVHTVRVHRGGLCLVQLDPDESILEVAAGRGGDCSKADATWCITGQPGGQTLFVKARSTAQADNHVVVISNRRSHHFNFVVQAETDSRPAVFQLRVRSPQPSVQRQDAGQRPAQTMARPVPADRAALGHPETSPEPEIAPRGSQRHDAETLSLRLQTLPQVVNADYRFAAGPQSADIVPTLVFDDGRFTYLRFAGNRELPAVFHVRGDGTETAVNLRMQDDLLVVDRVSQHLVLRAGRAVVGLWNESFDDEGLAPQAGTTVRGVARRLRPTSSPLGARP